MPGLSTVGPVMEPDPNWLLSTTAQSSAALVAIVGGFLLSRILALATERNGLALREAQLRDEVKLAEETYHSVQNRIDDSDRADFLRDAINLLGEQPDASLEDLGADPYGDLHPGELDELFETTRSKVQRAVEELRPYRPGRGSFSSLGASVPFAEVLPHLNLSKDEDIELYGQVWQLLDSSINRSFLPPVSPTGDFYKDWVRNRDKALEERVRAVSHLEIVRTELAKVSAPTGIGRLAMSLAFFLASGVVIPIAVLAQQPTRLASWQAWLTFAGFVVGLIAVAIVVAITVREAFPRSDKDDAVS